LEEHPVDEPVINQKLIYAGRWWLAPVILGTQETEIRRIEIRRIVVQSQPQQIVPQDLISKIHNTNRASRVTRDVGPVFKPQYWKKNLFMLFLRIVKGPVVTEPTGTFHSQKIKIYLDYKTIVTSDT
jgi:hypothetical protein